MRAVSMPVSTFGVFYNDSLFFSILKHYQHNPTEYKMDSFNEVQVESGSLLFTSGVEPHCPFPISQALSLFTSFCEGHLHLYLGAGAQGMIVVDMNGQGLDT